MKKSKVFMIFIWVAVFFIIFAVISFFLRFTNGGTDDFKMFYVEDEKQSVFATNDTADVYINAPNKYKVGYVFSSFTGDKKDFSVKIVPNITEETKGFLLWTSDGFKHTYSELKEVDFSELFNLEKQDDYFTFSFPDLTKYRSYLGHLFKDYNSDNLEDITSLNLFKIVVTSYNGRNEITLVLNPSYKYPDDVEFEDSDEPIIFPY